MEFDLTLLISSSVFILAASLLLYHQWKSSTARKEPPEASGAWPIVGHLNMLAGPEPPHITLGNMANKYGPIFMIKMGVHKTLVVSNWEIAKECFTTNDKTFATRPKALASELLGYNYGMFGFSPYGPYWREVRKIATLEMLSNHRLEILRHIRESEVKTSIKEIYDVWVINRRVLIDMKKWFADLTSNVVFRMVVGKRFLEATGSFNENDDDQGRRAMRSFSDLAGTFVLADSIPFLRWLDYGGYEKAMKKTAKDLDNLVERWFDEHKQRRSLGEVKDEELDFMHLMLSILDSTEGISTYQSDTIVKCTSLGLILAATDTTTVTLTWALTLLLNNPHTLKKAQQELDEHISRERQVNISDIMNLVYLQAILKETMRLYPAAPLSVPHQAVEDCTLAGYNISACTRLIVNLSKLHRDPNVWTDPYEFRPERFLTTHKEVDVKGQNFELIPFGSGRRICPGISFALQVMQLSLATLLHGFEISTPQGEAVDMRERIGLTNLKTSALEVLIKPRLSPSRRLPCAIAYCLRSCPLPCIVPSPAACCLAIYAQCTSSRPAPIPALNGSTPLASSDHQRPTTQSTPPAASQPSPLGIKSCLCPCYELKESQVQ